MKTLHTLAGLIGIALAQVAGAAEDETPKREPAVLADISQATRAAIERLKPASGKGWWLELGDALLVVGNVDEVRARLAPAAIRELGAIAPDDLVLHARGCGDSLLAPSLSLHTGLSYELMRRTASTQSATQVHAAHLGAAEWLPVVPNSVMAQRFEPGPAGVEPTDPYVLPIVQSVSPARWFADVETLASFDRSSYSSELTAARTHIAQQFAALGLEVTEPEFQFTSGGLPATVRNVIGRWNGTRAPDDWIVVGGHYDSRNTSGTAPLDTPGADDNASGCSGVIEAARVLTRFRPGSTMIFMCYAGEEQGLRGSLAHVSALNLAGDLGRVSHMANMDMIGWSSTPSLSVLLETTQPFQGMMIELAEAAATYAPELAVVTSLAPCCSDHMPYINAGRPAVLSIHRNCCSGPSAYPHYHRTTDTPVNLGPQAQAIGGAIIRMNVAALARWSGASDRVFGDTYGD